MCICDFGFAPWGHLQSYFFGQPPEAKTVRGKKKEMYAYFKQESYEYTTSSSQFKYNRTIALLNYIYFFLVDITFSFRKPS